MKNLITFLSLAAAAAPAVSAGSWFNAAKSAYVISQHPEEALTVGGFLLALFLMAIPAAIVGGIVALILKSVFELDKEDTMRYFYIVGGVLLGIFLLVYLII